MLLAENRARAARYGITIHFQERPFSRADIPVNGSALLCFASSTNVRGWHKPERFSISTTYPFGLFRAWAWMHMDLQCLVYPFPAQEAPVLPKAPVDSGGELLDESGQDDFSELRSYRLGDAPNHIAWKASARLTDELLVKQFRGGGNVQRVFDFDTLTRVETEQRLAILCRWIVEADCNGENYALYMPGEQIQSSQGGDHRDRCLKILALFGDKSEKPKMAA